MFFYLSKLLLFLLKPLIWVCLLLVLALLTKDEFKRKRRLLYAFICLFLFSNNFLVNEVLIAYEDKGNEQMETPYDVGLVLGGFSEMDTSLGRTVFFEANDRLMQAIKMYKQGHIKKIMISSGNSRIFNTELKEADAVRDYLLQIGIPDSSMIFENQSRNTIENIQLSKIILDSLNIHSKVLVFSSAWHLPRVKLCTKNRMDADYYACNFMSDRSRDFSPTNILVPSARALSNTEVLMKEFVGYIFYWFKN